MMGHYSCWRFSRVDRPRKNKIYTISWAVFRCRTQWQKHMRASPCRFDNAQRRWEMIIHMRGQLPRAFILIEIALIIQAPFRPRRATCSQPLCRRTGIALLPHALLAHLRAAACRECDVYALQYFTRCSFSHCQIYGRLLSLTQKPWVNF